MFGIDAFIERAMVESSIAIAELVQAKTSDTDVEYLAKIAEVMCGFHGRTQVSQDIYIILIQFLPL